MQTLREQSGQLLIMGFEGDACDPPLESLLRSVRPGGVIFFQGNISAAEQFQRLVWQIREVLGPLPPFLAIDLEGGQADRLRDVLAPLPSAQEAARADLARKLGEMAGRELAAFSLNLDFAPVLDLAAPESRPILDTRAAGETPEQVLHFAEEFLAGLAEQGILGCGKHFPGLGSACTDSHIALPRIEKSEEKLWQEDLAAFRALAPRLPMMMVAHAWYPALEKEYSTPHSLLPTPHSLQPIPASLSENIVSALLKGRMGFDGLVVCDDLEMGGVLQDRSIEEAAVAAVRAGCDMLLVCRSAENIERVLGALMREAERNPSFREQLECAVQRVRRAKQRLRIGEGNSGQSFSDWESLRDQIRRLGEEVQRRLSRPPELRSHD